MTSIQINSAHLDDLVPSGRDNDGDDGIGGESDTGDPVRTLASSRLRKVQSAHHSVWPSSVMLYLHSPSVFQSLILRSREADTICRLSAENETLGER